jgi:hypothetical protein
MLRFKFIIFFIFCVTLISKAQITDEVVPYVEPKGKSNLYLELGGSALLWSANYELKLFQNYSRSIQVMGRIGLGYSPSKYRLLNAIDLTENTLLMPFTTSLVLGKRKEKLEIGGGYTLAAQGVAERVAFLTGVLVLMVIVNN